MQLLADHLGTTDWESVDFEDTRVSQPSVFAAGIAATTTLRDDVIDAAFGHSLGEITAMTFAGALADEAAFSLVCNRAEICHRTQSAHPGQMVAVMGLDESMVEWARRSAIATTKGTIEVAAVNGRRQIVLSGDHDSVAAVISIVGELEGLSTVLPIQGAFHSPLMAPAVAPFRSAVEQTPFCRPRVPIVSAIDGVVYTEPQELASVVWRALLLPVRWWAALALARELDITSVYDAGPGTTLEKLARRGAPIRFKPVP